MKLWSIQVLRFVAALLVVSLHAVTYTHDLTNHYGLVGRAGSLIGNAGVDIFFVISGLIIARTSRGLSASEFIGKRARRVLPLYFLLTAPWMVVALALAHPGWRDLVASWLLWPATDRMTMPLIPVAWTLCFEALFYVAFAVIIWRRWAVWLIGLIYLTALTLRVGPALQFIGNPLILEFLAGVLLSFAPRWRLGALAIPIGVGILFAGGIFGWLPSGPVVDDLVGAHAWLRVATLGVPAVLIVWGVLQIEARRSVYTYLGDASYSLYLVHVPVVSGAVFLLARVARLPTDVVIAASIGSAVLVAWRVHELFEKPVLEWLRRNAVHRLPNSADK